MSGCLTRSPVVAREEASVRGVWDPAQTHGGEANILTDQDRKFSLL